MTKNDLEYCIIDALNANGGSARIADVCRHVWKHHISKMDQKQDLFYTWQYDIRWAAQKLRNNKKITVLPNRNWSIVK